MAKKKKRSEVTRLRERVRDLKNELANANATSDEYFQDRGKFRKFFIEELRLQIRAQGKGEYYSPAAMIEKYSAFIGKVEAWYWG